MEESFFPVALFSEFKAITTLLSSTHHPQRGIETMWTNIIHRRDENPKTYKELLEWWKTNNNLGLPYKDDE